MNSNRVASSLQYDEALRTFMLALYNYTAIGLALSGAVAYFVYASGLMVAMGALMWLFVFAPLGMILYYSFAGQKWKFETTRFFYYMFTAIMGVSLSTIFAVYTSTSIAEVFFITSATFAGASLYGYTTKKDLSGVGSFLIVGLIGIIIASIVNIFLQSSALQFAVSIIGVVVFTGLTAYDTQSAKSEFVRGNMDADETAKFAIEVALSLYLNFINLFQLLLSLLGDRD
jgi:FtsH-binding integral membrane protein